MPRRLFQIPLNLKVRDTAMLVGFVQEWRLAGDLWGFSGVFGEEAVAWDGEWDQDRSLACHGISRRVCRS